MTKARLRTCPNCGKNFTKLDGCNKMTCPCGTKVCYICQNDIANESHDHFRQPGGCCLHTGHTIQDIFRDVREAGVNVIERIRENGDGDGALKIDVDSLLRTPDNQRNI